MGSLSVPKSQTPAARLCSGPVSVPVVKEVDTGGVRLSPQTARSWAL